MFFSCECCIFVVVVVVVVVIVVVVAVFPLMCRSLSCDHRLGFWFRIHVRATTAAATKGYSTAMTYNYAAAYSGPIYGCHFRVLAFCLRALPPLYTMYGLGWCRLASTMLSMSLTT